MATFYEIINYIMIDQSAEDFEREKTNETAKKGTKLILLPCQDPLLGCDGKDAEGGAGARLLPNAPRDLISYYQGG